MNSPDSHRLELVERAVSDIRDAVGQIAQAMDKIARLEERHQETRASLGRAFDRLDSIEKTQGELRVTLVRLEAAIVPLQESRGWMVKGMLALTGLVGFSVIGLVLVK